MQEPSEKLISVNITDEIKSAYIDYSMSVIVSRALPDVRDGLKPVHRRVLYGMYEQSNYSDRPHKKCARIVGDVMGKYHPHGDSSVYDTMVRMAQPWSLRYLLVDGHGNFGSVDGDSPAAMRYTEARMQKMSQEMLKDIDKDTVDFQPNFDDSLQEPIVLPARIPNLLVNGASGIAVGMATNIPPHNLSEVVNATIAYINNNEISIDELCEHITAPDFPTGGIIYGYEGVKDAFHTGRGRVVMRAKHHFEDLNGRTGIIITEIPYMVNKAEMIRKTAEMIHEKKLEGISTIRDESDRNGMRIVYVVKKDAVADVVLNKLFKHTQLQSSFGVNNIALVNGRPELLNLKDMIRHYVDHRHEVLVRQTRYELLQAQKRLHILEGLLIAIDNLDEIVQLIRSTSDRDQAKKALMERYSLSEIQANAILDLRLYRLTGLERDKIKAEHKEVSDKIDSLNAILSDEGLRMTIIKDDLTDVKENFGDERRSEVNREGGKFNIEDTIPNESVVVTLTHAGYIKRSPLAEYKVQKRGGIGQRGAGTRDEDFLERVYIATNHQYMLFFTDKGRCYWLRVFELPEGSKTTKGRAIQNLISLTEDEKICAFMKVDSLKDEDYLNSHYICMVSKLGTIKRCSLKLFSNPRMKGIHAMNVRDNDTLTEVLLTDGHQDLMLAVRTGKSIRFEESSIRPSGRTSMGVRGIRLKFDTDYVVGMISISPTDEDQTILVVSENGFGKRSQPDEYRKIRRGGQGIKTINVTDKTGYLVGIKNVAEQDEMIIINKSGTIIRTDLSGIRIAGRNTMGVRLIKPRDKDTIASITTIQSSLLNQENEEPNPESSSDEVID